MIRVIDEVHYLPERNNLTNAILNNVVKQLIPHFKKRLQRINTEGQDITVRLQGRPTKDLSGLNLNISGVDDTTTIDLIHAALT